MSNKDFHNFLLKNSKEILSIDLKAHFEYLKTKFMILLWNYETDPRYKSAGIIKIVYKDRQFQLTNLEEEDLELEKEMKRFILNCEDYFSINQANKRFIVSEKVEDIVNEIYMYEKSILFHKEI